MAADLEELNHCRLCFSPNNLTDAMFPAGASPNEELLGMIYACTSVRISFERDFPCAVCSSCVRIVNQFYAFRRKVRGNDRVLQRSRGEKRYGMEEDEESGDGEDDQFDDEEYLDEYGGDPLELGLSVKRGGDGQFYGQMKRQIQSYLKQQVAELEKRALAKVREGLRNRSAECFVVEASGLQQSQEFAANKTEGNDSVEFETFKVADEPEICENDTSIEGTDWKTKYLTLQKNNDLLQKAFREQKTKLKDTEQLLKSVKRYKVESSADGAEGIGFQPHPALPNISVEFLQDLNYRSGPGQKGDRSFVSKLAVAVFGEETMVNSSVTGRSSNAHQGLKAKPPLCPLKMAAITLKLFERVQLEVGAGGSREELLGRSNERNVRLTVCQKSMNLRKQYLKHNGGGSGGAGNVSMDDDEMEAAAAVPPPPARKRRVR